MQSATPIPVFFGSVNRWECDENDHLNVRFFAQKIQQTLQYGLIESGLANAEEALALTRKISSQHMRFIAEARMAVPITGYFSVTEVSDTVLSCHCELRNTATDSVLASFLIDLAGDFSGRVDSLAPLPDHAGSRGVAAAPYPFKDLEADELIRRGCSIIGQGVVQADECDSDGYLQNYQYIGRQSDSMPNLFSHFETEQRGNGIVGGAVLEYRMSYFSQLKCGDRFKILSGVKELGEKTQIFMHSLFNADSGKMVTGSEALAISMDLTARKAIAIPEDRRERMSDMLIQMS
jgi:acyl-CoA thioester hydrolase